MVDGEIAPYAILEKFFLFRYIIINIINCKLSDYAIARCEQMTPENSSMYHAERERCDNCGYGYQGMPEKKGGRKSKKVRKSRKSRKSKKVRKSRKSRKSKKVRKSKKSRMGRFPHKKSRNKRR
jgi:hypothetical protein